METTGERIKRYREASGMTQEELAAKIKTSPQNIYKYEKGIIHNIPIGRIQSLSEVFGIPPSQLVGWGCDSHAKFKHSDRENIPIKPVEFENLSEDERTLLSLYRQTSPEYRKSLLQLLEVTPKRPYEYETLSENDQPIRPLELKLASTLPPYKFRNENNDK